MEDDYYGNELCTIYAGSGFGGYQDWTYKEFAAKLSIRDDHKDDFQEFEIGTTGLCICCGDEIRGGLYCGSCDEGDDEEEHEDDDYGEAETCADCDISCDEVYAVHDSRGFVSFVCSDCRDEYYARCDICNDYHPKGEMTELEDGRMVCRQCRDESSESDAA